MEIDLSLSKRSSKDDFSLSFYINILSANTQKWSNTLKQFVGKSRVFECLTILSTHPNQSIITECRHEERIKTRPLLKFMYSAILKKGKTSDLFF